VEIVGYGRSPKTEIGVLGRSRTASVHPPWPL